MGEEDALDIMLLVLILALSLPILGMVIKDMNTSIFNKYSLAADKALRRIDGASEINLIQKTANGVTTQETRDLRGSDIILMMAIADDSMPNPKVFVFADVPNTGVGENTVKLDYSYSAVKLTHIQKAVKGIENNLNQSMVIRRTLYPNIYWDVRRAN